MVNGCLETSTCLLARYVWRNRNKVRFLVLFPRVKNSRHAFIANDLPFDEDLRRFPFASWPQQLKPDNTGGHAQERAAQDLIDSMTLMVKEDEEDSDEEEWAKPVSMMNPVLQSFYHNVALRAQDPSADLQPPNPRILSYTQAPEVMMERSKARIRTFNEAFPTEMVPKKKRKRQRVQGISDWKQYEEGDLAALLGEPVKKEEAKDENDGLGLDDDDGLGLNDVLEGQVTSIGSATPTDDFVSIYNRMAQSGDPGRFKKLCAEMWQMVHNTIQNSFQAFDYPKAVDCVKCLREHCIKEEEPNDFNAAAREFKRLYKSPKPAVWRTLADANITLLSPRDFGMLGTSCNATNQDADGFLKEEVKAPVAAPPPMVEEEDDSDESLGL